MQSYAINAMFEDLSAAGRYRFFICKYLPNILTSRVEDICSRTIEAVFVLVLYHLSDQTVTRLIMFSF